MPKMLGYLSRKGVQPLEITLIFANKQIHCTKTDASKLVEYTKAYERMLLKELGKIAL